jgi:cellulose synthase/poly-beta-1,6-N-acetylglucosamine synthase-like glycosyltransferase
MAILEIVTLGLVGAGLLLLVPVTVLLIEVVAAVLPGKPGGAPATTFPKLAVLVPAHDEAIGIAETLRNIQAELSPGDRLLVVADNCTDATAEIAEAEGAEVIRRTDTALRGKSYALDFGIRHLAGAPPDVVVIVDADCRLDEGSLRTIGARAFAIGRPVQAHYELLAPDGPRSPGRAIAVFAAKVKNYLRPLGLYRLGLPCQLAGTGMAFPWQVFSRVDLKSGELTEDLVLGLDLARIGLAAEFSPEARVTSRFPTSAEGTRTQRARWETGHLTTITRRVPGLVVEALRSRNKALLALALDAAVPPLALQAMALIALFALSLLGAIAWGAYGALAVGAVAIALFGLSIVVAWRSVGRDNITLMELARAPAYVLSKIPLYAEILRGKRISWIRSKRD